MVKSGIAMGRAPFIVVRLSLREGLPSGLAAWRHRNPAWIERSGQKGAPRANLPGHRAPARRDMAEVRVWRKPFSGLDRRVPMGRGGSRGRPVVGRGAAPIPRTTIALRLVTSASGPHAVVGLTVPGRLWRNIGFGGMRLGRFLTVLGDMCVNLPIRGFRGIGPSRFRSVGGRWPFRIWVTRLTGTSSCRASAAALMFSSRSSSARCSPGWMGRGA